MRAGKPVVLLLALVLALASSLPAAAQDEAPAGRQQLQVYDEQQLAQMEKDAGFMEKLTAGLVLAIPKFLVRVLHLQDPMVLVFQEVPPGLKDEFKPANWVPPEDMYFYTFQPGEFEAVARIYDTLEGYLPVSLTLMLVFAAVVLFAAGFSAEKRLGAKSALLGIAVAVLAVRLGPYLMGLVFDLNRALVLVFRSTFAHLPPVAFLDLLWREDTKSLGMALVVFVAAMTLGVLNWQYAMRKLTLGILIFSFPLVCVLAVVPSRRGALEIWFREFVANVFLQSAHAAVYAFFLLFIGATRGQFGSFWTVIAFLLGLDGLSEVLRRLVGAQTLSGTGAGLIGGALGLGSVFALGRLAFAGLRGPAGGGLAGPGGAGDLAGAALGAGAGAGPAGGAGLPPPGAGFGYRLTGGLVRGAGTAAALAAAPVGLMAGAMVGGAAAGEADLGAEFGLAGGAAAGGWAWQRSGAAARTLRSMGEEALATGRGFREIAARRLGIYGGAQWVDPAATSRAGRAVAGLPGALAGGAVGWTARGASYLGLAGRGPGSGARELVAGVEAYREAAYGEYLEARRRMAELQPQYDLAKSRLDYAKHTYGTDSNEYWQARHDFDQVAAQMDQCKIREIEASQRLSYDSARAKYLELRDAQRRSLSGTTADEVS